MSPAPGQVLRSVLRQYEREILGEWIQNQLGATTVRGELMREGELREQCREFLTLLNAAVQAGSIERHDSAEWNSVREFLGMYYMGEGRWEKTAENFEKAVVGFQLVGDRRREIECTCLLSTWTHYRGDRPP